MVYLPGALSLEAASGMTAVAGEPWSFHCDNHDPHTRPIVLPAAVEAADVRAVSIELDKPQARPGERVELFLILDNGKQATLEQRLETSLQAGRHRYVFETSGLRWMTGQLKAIRLDPGTAPGTVSIKSIGVHTDRPEAREGDIVVPVPADQKQSLGAESDTFADASALRYRLSSEWIDFAIMDAYAGQSKVLKLHIRNAARESRRVMLAFASTDSRVPFSPIVPPYVGLDAERFGVQVWAGNSADIDGASFVVTRTDGTRETFDLQAEGLRADQWNVLSWPLSRAGDVRAPVNNVEFVRNVPPGTDAFLYVANPVLDAGDWKQPYELLTTEMPLLIRGMTKPLAGGAPRALPTRPTLALGGFDIANPAIAARIPVLKTFIEKEFPGWDFVLAPVWTPPLALAAELPKLPEGFFFQFQKARMSSDYLRVVDAMPRNAEGETLKAFNNSVVGTHPVLRQGLKDQIDYAASLGVNSFKQIDMVWPWQGRWGYDDCSVKACRDDLNGADEGLDILPGLPGKLSAGGVIHFWDYYEYYHGFRLKPGDLGLEKWSEYRPVSEQEASTGDEVEKLNLGLFVMLYHYEWLRQAQRFGRWAKAHGGRHDYTLNPEDLGNGGDYVFLSRIVDAGTIYVEYFGGPSVLTGGYYNLPMYVSLAKRAGRKMGLILEIGQTGHGEHYLAPETNYLFAFELAAAGLENYHNEWVTPPLLQAITVSASTVPQKTYGFDRWSSWVSGALGFVFAREANVHRATPRVFNITTRSPGYYVSSWIWGLNQGPSFGPLLASSHVAFEQWDRSSMPLILDQADVIFYTPPEGRGQDWAALRQWLRQPGKVLVTHSNVPFSTDDGQARLSPGLTAVEYTGVDQQYTDLLALQANCDSAVFEEFEGLCPLGDGRWSAIPGADVVAGSSQSPLISRRRLSSGSEIWYLHCDPRKLDASEEKTVMNMLVGELRLPRDIVSSTTPVMAHRYKTSEYEVLNVWTGLDLPGFRGGYGPHLMPERGPHEFDPEQRPYPYLLPQIDTAIEVPVTGKGMYRVYAFLSGEEYVVPVSSAGILTLRVKGTSVEQFFFAPEGADIRESLASVKNQRSRLLPYGPDLPRAGN